MVWNRINSGSLSQILGTLNANGYVILQNPSGFVIGGQASINTHGLLMTTAPTPAPDLSAGGPWSFNTPPPAAKIINYGQINIAGGGSAFLIASDIQNNGTITAPGGKIGLYAGEQVLVSSSPNGLGLSAQVTLPQGSVDNEGRLIADAGSIAAQAQTVNQNGLVQANSVQNVNGVIELVAGDSVTLGPSSQISARGDDATPGSSGGTVTVMAGNSFSDSSGSQINTAGGAQGGNGGNVEVSAPDILSLNSSINAGAQPGWLGGSLTLDPENIVLGTSGTTSGGTTGTILGTGTSGELDVNVSTAFKNITSSSILLEASGNITLGTAWTLSATVPAAETTGQLTLLAGNNITFNSGSSISAGNWNVTLTAGAGFAPTAGQPTPLSGNDGIYLNGNAYLQTQAGNINLWAANEVQVGWPGYYGGPGMVNPGIGRVTTTRGGSISVATEYGDINTGSDVNGYRFGQYLPPYYSVSSTLGGISTAAGGNVTLTAGRDVISYLPLDSDYQDAQNDAGSGAFGPGAGNVTITAGGNVYGHYVVANGVGTVTAGGDVGAPLDTLTYNPGAGFALSLITGSWNVNAPNGSIYLQEVRNPNGTFDEMQEQSSPDNPGYHYFDYAPQASVLLNAADSVEITGFDAPRDNPSSGNSIPLIFPPSLTVIAGAGGFILDDSTILNATVVLFPSPYQSLTITTLDGGNFGIPNSENPYATDPVTVEMSYGGSSQWTSPTSFTPADQAASLPAFINAGPVAISISGSMNAVNLYTTKAAQINVAGDMINCGFQGQNLGSGDVTSINVAGQLFNSPLDSFVQLNSGIVSANPLQPALWDSVFELALTPGVAAGLTSINVDAISGGIANLPVFLQSYLLFPNTTGVPQSHGDNGANVGFIYDPISKIMGFQGIMANRLSAGQIAALEGGALTVLVADAGGNPLVVNGHLETASYTFSAAAQIAALEVASVHSVYDTTATPIGYQIGGPGQFIVNAATMNLGNTPGIASLGFQANPAFETLLPIPAAGGASVTVNVAGDLNMITSSIYSEDGGNVNVTAGGDVSLSQGTQGTYFDLQTTACYGIYTSGHSDVNVTAHGNINVGNARIASFDGGDVFVESLGGSVDLGGGVTEAVGVQGVFFDPITGLPVSGEFGDYADAHTLLLDPPPYGSGILAELPTKRYQTGGVTLPGNITVETPNGNIISTSGGISQFALDASILGPKVNLIAGTPGITAPTDPDAGNIRLGQGGVVGGEINVEGTGQVQGFFVSQQNLNLTSQTFTGLGLAGKTANVSANAAGDGPVLVVGIGAVKASGLGESATLLGQNVSANGGGPQSTLGTSVNASPTATAAAAAVNNAPGSQVASNAQADDDQKKNNKPKPALVRRVKRVTVLLPNQT